MTGVEPTDETEEPAASDEPDHRGVLIYDGDCPFCSAASSALRRVDGVAAVEWDREASQAFLEAQFGETPFVLALVDREDETVWIGREAARELCDRAGLPVLIGDVVGDNYESIADAVRTVAGGEREADSHHGAFELTDAAADRYAALAASARTTHVPPARRE